MAETDNYDERRKELYPLFPTLAPEGVDQMVEIIETLKGKMKDVAEDAISEVYSDLPGYIESDAWGNFRTELMRGFSDYGNRKVQNDYDFKTIRQEILKEFRDEIIEDLDQDNLARIADLERQLESALKDARHAELLGLAGSRQARSGECPASTPGGCP